MKTRWEWWQRIVFFWLALQAVLWLIPQTRPGIPGLVCWVFGSDTILWWGIALAMVLWGVIQSAVRRPFWNRRRAGGLLLILVLAYTPFTFRVYPSSHDNAPSEVRFRVPLDGPVTVAWGGATPDVNYHVKAADQRWVYDLVVTKGGKSHRGEGKTLEEYYCYGMPVYAPADGVVIGLYTEATEMPVGVLGGSPATGNHVALEVAQNEFLFLCHLKPGSVSVKSGDRVRKGQVIAQVGNSGNTSEPHLHIHLQATPIPLAGEGIPLCFHDYRSGDRTIDRGIPAGGFSGEKFSGETIENVG